MVQGRYYKDYGKKRVTSGKGGGGSLTDIYVQMFKYYHLLPDEVGRQDPKLLFELIYGLDESGTSNQESYSSPYLRAVYGY